MSIEVTVRHMQGAEDMQEYAKGKAQEIVDDFPKIEHIHAVLKVEGHRHAATFSVQSRRHLRISAEEESDNMRVSIDTAVEKVYKQLRKVADKVHDHKPAMKRGEAAKNMEEND